MNALKNIFTHLLLICSFLLLTGVTTIDAKIVFRVDDDLVVMNDDGTQRRRITNNSGKPTKDSAPRWSPDGKRIIFTRYMDKTKIQTSSEIFIINADGTNPQRLTHNNVTDGDPSWSPDGQRITYTSKNGERFEVFVMDIESRSITQLTDVEDGFLSAAPDWSPDGEEIVFERFIQLPGISPKTIYVMNADGTNQRPALPDPPIGKAPVMRFFPKWAKNTRQILSYEVKWGQQERRRFFVQTLGGGKREITDINDRLGNEWIIAGACWADNDRAFLFSIKRTDTANPNYNLYRYGFENRSLRRLTAEPEDEKFPDWIEGTLNVSTHKKLATQWGKIKRERNKNEKK